MTPREYIEALFPNPMYSIHQVATVFHRHPDTVRYWFLKWDVPMFKITGSPFVLREVLVDFIMRADRDNASEDDNIGLAVCLAKLAENAGKAAKSPKHFPE
jgi:hypothetical protein